MKPNSLSRRHKTGKRTELRRVSKHAARRLEQEAAEREWRLFLTAKFDRTWKAMLRFRAKVGDARFREMMVELLCTLSHFGSDDERPVAAYSWPRS